ncbi:MAG: hypothetical protein PVH00_01230 [Gemmatimonadota bacterium]|jgi:hypothetical protein
MERSTDFRTFLPAIYPVAALLMIAPIAELVGLGWPLRPAETAWRFGSMGLGFGAMIVQILGLTLAMFTAAALGHRRTLRALAFLSIVSATLIVAGMARFLMDYGQLRVAIPSESRSDFDASTLRALISATLAVPVLLALGARSLGQTRDESRQERPVDEPVDPRSYVIPFRYRQPR